MNQVQNLETMVESSTCVVAEVSLDPATKSYARYQELGGIINQEDYRSALERAKNATTFNKGFILSAEGMAQHAGIVFKNSEDTPDPRAALYAVMREDRKPGAEYYHGQMSDQRLFAEVLRMLEDDESLTKLKSAYYNISFH